MRRSSDTLVLHRALQYAATFGYTVWLRPNDAWLGNGVAAKGPLATRLGLSGVPVLAETIALATIFELMRDTGARVHLCRLSSAAGVALVRRAKAEGLPVTCDVSIHQLHLIDVDIGYFDSAMRLVPPLRQQRDRDAIRAGARRRHDRCAGRDHTPVDEDAKHLPFAEAEPGATGLELLLGSALKWGEASGSSLARSARRRHQPPGCGAGALDRARGRQRRRAASTQARSPTSASSLPDESWTVDGTTLAAAAITRRSRATSCRAGCAARWSRARSPTTR